MKFLVYFFEFLNAFDFGTASKEAEGKTIISASILGNVFERLNAYKDGSFYTPSAITAYMCKESLERVVLQKFNEANPQWQCKNLSDIEYEINREMRQSKDKESIKTKYKTLLKEIRICDPAVGSGHFLVSALNAMIQIHYELGLIDSKIHNLGINNDEIDITNFAYKRDSQGREYEIQKELFTLKQSIIENNLFGVDINPNSVEICRLRLWIELLKNSYYLKQGDEGYDENLDSAIHQMQTLPNIDINIKCGNSLLGNFPLSEESLGKTNTFTNNLKEATKNYKNQVALYKIGGSDKASIIKEIEKIKALFREYLVENKYYDITFNETLYNFTYQYGTEHFASNDAFNLEMQKRIKNNAKFDIHKLALPQDCNKKRPLDTKGQKLLDSLKARFENAQSIKNNDSFEWRFAFPEVLDSNGDFMGFDLVIGNPPYMEVPKGVFSKEFFPYTEGKSNGKQNTYRVFIEQGYNLAKPKGENWFITQSSLMCDKNATYTRELLLDNTMINQCIEFPKKYKVFTNVTQGVCIIGFSKEIPKRDHTLKISIDNNLESIQSPTFAGITQSHIKEVFTQRFEIPLVKKGELQIIEKLNKTFSNTLKDFIVNSAQGNINTIHLKRIKSETPTEYFIAKGENIHRYYLDNNLMFAKITDETTNIVKKNQESGHIIAMQGINGTNDIWRIHCTLLESKNTNKFVFLDSTKMLFVECKESAKYLVGLLNSKLLDWLFRKTSTNNNINIYELESLPIPKIDSKNQKIADEIVNLVDTILEAKNLCHTIKPIFCHTERSEVSQSTKEIFRSAQNDNRDISAFSNPQYDKQIKDLQSQIDSLVYKLYGLDSNEIEIIKSK